MEVVKTEEGQVLIYAGGSGSSLLSVYNYDFTEQTVVYGPFIGISGTYGVAQFDNSLFLYTIEDDGFIARSLDMGETWYVYEMDMPYIADMVVFKDALYIFTKPSYVYIYR